jgi:putative glutamine amidotransferase
VSAIDSHDGSIEAIERSDRTFVLGVQWHPEDQIHRNPEQLKLFQRFGDAVDGRIGVRFPE